MSAIVKGSEIKLKFVPKGKKRAVWSDVLTVVAVGKATIRKQKWKLFDLASGTDQYDENSEEWVYFWIEEGTLAISADGNLSRWDRATRWDDRGGATATEDVLVLDVRVIS